MVVWLNMNLKRWLKIANTERSTRFVGGSYRFADRKGLEHRKSLCPLLLRRIAKIEHSVKGSFRGANRISSKLDAQPVNARLRAIGRRAFAFLAHFPKDCGGLVAGPALSVSRDRNRGPNGTPRVPSAPKILARKLSESLVNNPFRVSRPVSFAAVSVNSNRDRAG